MELPADFLSLGRGSVNTDSNIFNNLKTHRFTKQTITVVA